MDKEIFIKLFQQNRLELPIKSDDRDVYSILKYQFEEYKNLLRINHVNDDELKKASVVCDSLLKAIEQYYLGTPVNAYQKVKKILDKMNNRNQLILYKKNEQFSKYSTNSDPLNLYRVRPVDEPRQYTREEIFHVPFSRRRLVSASRFSIAGYPSLYLGTSPDLSRIETGLEKRDRYIVSKFKIERELNKCETNIYVLNLAIKPNEIKNFVFSNDIYGIEDERFRKSYIEAYPLIAACSIMVEKKNKNFYPEYIIPQLVMQWLNEKANQDKKSIYGVKYFTCRSKNPRIKGYNYVFPVQSYDIARGVEDYCEVLSSIFKLTEPVSSTTDGFEDVMEQGLLRKLY